MFDSGVLTTADADAGHSEARQTVTVLPATADADSEEGAAVATQNIGMQDT